MATTSMNVVIILSFCLWNVQGGIPRFFRGRPRHGMLIPPPLPKGVSTPQEMWFDQQLDHFNDADSKTWKQRYFTNNTFHQTNGPIFLMIGGEGTADPIWMVEGAWITYAQKFNAVCFMLEHRYYGKSHPTKDMSVKNLEYLSSEQALADLANFIQFIKEKYNLHTSKLITFGGSYPGSLSAWFRMKYPHLVDGAVATSAPIYAVLDFKEYLQVVVDSLSTSGTQCVTNIQAATTALTKLLSTMEGLAQSQKMFKLCDRLDTSADKANLYSNLAGNFEGVVQYNKDNRAFEGAIGTNVTIDTLCGIMNDPSKGADPLSRYAAVNDLMLQTYSEKCLDNSYTNMIQDLKNVSWEGSASEGGRQWTYQTCTEFGFFQTSGLNDKQPFGNFFAEDFFTLQCTDIFGENFNEKLIQRGINRTNTNYGGYGIKITKVIFPNGSIDPWHALGVTKDLSPDAVAVYINGTAHCANMYPSLPSDPPSLVQARETIQKYIGQWLS
ncbi:hypothetical protein FSP39_013868 [Pinctada imbricata]|uniref:Serine protease K12H4.7 n=1 Tax=Pinctada imbricata TaxID=66713 RepID=A0AA89BUT0_PINIB|nr:hypothetical protein FSP39_013868 [Pinctada imbricata]